MRRIRLNKRLSYRTFPHRCELGALDFQITEYTLNGQSSSEPESEQYVDLTEYDGWDTLTLEVEVTIPEGLLGKVFPEFGKIPGMLVLSAHCRETYLRERFLLARDPISSGTYTGTWEFDAGDVAGSLDLRPILVRTTDINESMDYASDAGIFVADGQEWQIEVSDDEGDEGLLDIRTKQFSEEHESGVETRFPPEDRMYYLDLELDSESPVLWLNEDQEDVVSLFRNPESNYEKLTSGLAWSQVMTPVWTRLVTIAATEYDAEEDEWIHEWQGAIFDELQGEGLLYEDHTPEKAAERLQEDLSESVVQATKRIEDAVQARLEPAKHYAKHRNGLTDK